MNEFDRLIDEYMDMFGEAFPVFGLEASTDEEYIAILKKCIETKTPAVPVYSDKKDVKY